MAQGDNMIGVNANIAEMPTGVQYHRKHLNLQDLDEPFDSRPVSGHNHSD